MSKKFKQPKPKRTLKAIDKLIEHYEKYPMDEKPSAYPHIHAGNCPLCDVHISGYQQTSCNDCPWIYIDQQGCSESFYSRDTTITRLSRLNRWKRKIQGGKPCQLK